MTTFAPMNNPSQHSAADRIAGHGLRPTPVRMLVLRLLDKAKRPLSALEIEQALDTVDRSSITRTLTLFVENGLVHMIADGSGAAKYESCPSECHHSPADMHVHFHCTGCGHTFCLPSTAVPQVKLPQGFKACSTNYIITGLCPDCATDND